jgi:hypothetical protein
MAQPAGLTGKPDRKPVDQFVESQNSLLVLTWHNQTARAFRGSFDRRISLWERHMRVGLEKLVVAKGFSPSAFGNDLQKEISEWCAKPRKGKVRGNMCPVNRFSVVHAAEQVPPGPQARLF